MDDESLLDGSATGLRPSLARAGLSAASVLYGLGRRVHHAWYTRGPGRRVRLERPVLSVGNLTVGGVGKTPFVADLARRTFALGGVPVVLARGYGRRPGEDHNDEGRWLERRVPGLRVLQDPDRAGIAGRFLQQGGVADLFLLDDGFQHERLARDLDLVLLDATRPFGHGHLLPRGLLREPLPALARAHLLALTRCESATAERLEEIERTLRRHSDASILRVELPSLRARVGEVARPLGEWRSRSAEVLCAVGNPRSVVATLERAGIEVSELHTFRDHHEYTRDEVLPIAERARRAGRTLFTTEKDAVKLERLDLGLLSSIAVLEQELRIVAGEEELEGALEGLLRSGAAGRRPGPREVPGHAAGPSSAAVSRDP